MRLPLRRRCTGQWRDEHLFALAQAVALYDVCHQKIADCDCQIAAHLHTFADHSAGQPLPLVQRPRKRPRNRPPFDVRSALHRMMGAT